MIAFFLNMSWSFTQSHSLRRVRLASAMSSTREVARGFPTDIDTSDEGSVKIRGERFQFSYDSFHMANPTDIDIETLGGSSEGGGVVKKTMMKPTDIDIDSEGSPIKKSGSIPVMVLEGDSSEEQPYQRAVVAAHFCIVITNVVIAVSTILSDAGGLGLAELLSTKVAPIVATFIASIVLGDIGTGVFHWSVDNYGSLKTPVVGSICHAFQGHHDTPWTITFRSLANNLYKVAYGCAPSLFLLCALPNVGPMSRLFFALFINWWLLSQELHKYSHMKANKTPALVKRMMDMGLILSRKEHGRHHTPPFDSNYCILTGHNNRWMDDSKLFRRLERVVFELTGNEPNTWNEAQGGDSVRKAAMDL